MKVPPLPRRRRRGVPTVVPEPGSARADRYELLTARLDTLRATMGADTRGTTAAVGVRADHAELSRLLGDAVSDAMAADAVDASMPVGMTSWMAEGLARSEERELALLAATDVMGVAAVMTVESPRWGS
jgi:hypothetical protein